MKSNFIILIQLLVQGYDVYIYLKFGGNHMSYGRWKYGLKVLHYR